MLSFSLIAHPICHYSLLRQFIQMIFTNDQIINRTMKTRQTITLSLAKRKTKQQNFAFMFQTLRLRVISTENPNTIPIIIRD
jgi:hypothetical protein